MALSSGQHGAMTSIRVGIGGWVYAPWRDNFYPKGLAQSRELHHASRHVTSIEINGTFYGAQKPASFRKWYDETPQDFVFAVKGTRYATHRRALAESKDSVARFLGSGVLELKEKLGPILWQFPGTTKFEAGNFEDFLGLLPPEMDGRRLRHVLDVSHASFADPGFAQLLKRHKVGVAFIDDADRPGLEVDSADFFYARLRRTEADEATGYAKKALGDWAKRARDWSQGGNRDVFVYFISGAKERNPAAAQALIERLK